MKRLIKASNSQSHCSDFSVHQSRIQPLEVRLNDYELKYLPNYFRHQELLDYIHRVDDENKKLKTEVENMKNKCYPLRAAATKIQLSPSPTFSSDSSEVKHGIKNNSKSYKYFTNLD